MVGGHVVSDRIMIALSGYLSVFSLVYLSVVSSLDVLPVQEDVPIRCGLQRFV